MLFLGLSIFVDGAVWPFLTLSDLFGALSAGALAARGLAPSFFAPALTTFGGDAPTLSFFLDPAADVDASAATDADDLVVFVADIFEFAEHEQALVVDAVADATLAGVASLGGAASFALSVRALKR